VGYKSRIHEQWKYNNTYSGTPQGAVLSPLFANIYLDKLDKFRDKAHTWNTRGKQRARNHEYEVANARAYYAKREGKLKNQKSGSKSSQFTSKDTNIELQKAKICALC